MWALVEIGIYKYECAHGFEVDKDRESEYIKMIGTGCVTCYMSCQRVYLRAFLRENDLTVKHLVVVTSILCRLFRKWWFVQWVFNNGWMCVMYYSSIMSIEVEILWNTKRKVQRSEKFRWVVTVCRCWECELANLEEYMNLNFWRVDVG